MPQNEITGGLVIDQMKQIAYDAMMVSKGAVSVNIEVWAHRCDEEPRATVKIYYHANRSYGRECEDLRSLAKDVYGRLLKK